MPAEGMVWLDRSEILSFEEIERVARICVEHFEVDSLRLTGGEPTVRAHLTVLIDKLSKLRVPTTASSEFAGKQPDIALTTNASTLRNIAYELKAAGLSRINVSLDSLHRERFEQMTRRDELENVLEGIKVAQDAGFSPVKLNAVIERGMNDDEIVSLATFGRDTGVEVRFIEFMPLDASEEWGMKKVVSQDEIVAAISAVYPLEQMSARGAAPADRWRYLDGRGVVGVIPSVTKPFCADCDRVRITADGQFRTCLFSTTEFDVRAVLRNGGTDDDIARLIRTAVATKWAGHQIGHVNFIRPNRSMSQIGG